MPKIDWNEQNVARLLKMWGDGDTVRNIAAVFGVTAGAIIGKLYRMGIDNSYGDRDRKCGPSQKIHSTHMRIFRERKKKIDDARFTARKNRDSRFTQDGITDVPPDQSPFACTIVDVGDNQCRWPLGDPSDLDTFRYCGAPGKPYCDRHARIAYGRRVLNLSADERQRRSLNFVKNYLKQSHEQHFAA